MLLVVGSNNNGHIVLSAKRDTCFIRRRMPSFHMNQHIQILNFQFAILVASLVLVSAGNIKADDGLLRVMTYNIHHCQGTDGRTDIQRIANVIKTAKADLVALQEVDYMTKRSGRIDQAAKLGELCGMKSFFGRAIDYQGGRYGNAVLSKDAHLEIENLRLPGRGAENRNILAVSFPLARRLTVTFASTHFDHKSVDARAKAANFIAKTMPQKRSLMIVAGDLNCSPDSEELRPLSKMFRSVNEEPLATFPNRSPKSQIDFILYDRRSRWSVESVEVIDDGGASDHRPLLAVIKTK